MPFFAAAFRNPDGSIRSGLQRLSQRRRTSDQRPGPAPALEVPSAACSRLAGSRRRPNRAGACRRRACRRCWPGSPFPGLRAFTPLDDAPIFFGRGRRDGGALGRPAGARRAAFRTWRSAPPAPGKSSLVAAVYLLPRLQGQRHRGRQGLAARRERVSGGRAEGACSGWVCASRRGNSDDDPFAALAAKLAPMLPAEAAGNAGLSSARALAAKPAANPRRVRRSGAGGQAPAWSRGAACSSTSSSEPYRRWSPSATGNAFAALLAAAARTLPGCAPWRRMRADFYHRCARAAAHCRKCCAAASLHAGRRPGLAALFEMVTGPGRAGGDWHCEEGLAARILEDARQRRRRPGAARSPRCTNSTRPAAAEGGIMTLAAYESVWRRRGRDQRVGPRRPSRGLSAESAMPCFPPCSADLVGAGRARSWRRGAARPRSQLVSSPEAAALVDALTKARLRWCSGAGRGWRSRWSRWRTKRCCANGRGSRDWIARHADDLRTLHQAEAAAGEWRRFGGKSIYRWPDQRLVSVYQALPRLGLSIERLDEPAKSFLRSEAEVLLEELRTAFDTTHRRRVEIGDRLVFIGRSASGRTAEIG
ncbi:MAG: hypothetical protein MZW92_52045 [Comamonadaceae bacterium]|nr:hypothetical protein [Comamonadaceae bacterium]